MFIVKNKKGTFLISRLDLSSDHRLYIAMMSLSSLAALLALRNGFNGLPILPLCPYVTLSTLWFGGALSFCYRDVPDEIYESRLY
jgi:hypothetical protein